MTPITVELEYFKETKRKVAYSSVIPGQAIDLLYIDKTHFEDQVIPPRITLSVEQSR